MNFKLTVARKVIGGFLITAVLLVLLGLNSVAILNDITTSSEKVNNLSIPALESTGTLQQRFVAMSKTTLLDYYANTEAETSASEELFSNQKLQIEDELKELRRTVSEEPSLKKQIPVVDKSFHDFTDSAQQLFIAKKRSLSLIDEMTEQLDETEMAADDATSYILDFTDLNEFEENDQAFAAASRLESNLTSVITTINDLFKVDNRETVETIQKELSFFVNNIKEAKSDFENAIVDRELNGTEDIIDQLDTFFEFMNADNSLLALKFEWLNTIDRRDQLLDQTTELSETAINQLRALANAVKAELENTTNSVNQTVSNGEMQSYAVMAIAILLSIAIAYKTITSVTKPLSEVNEALTIVATGDLTVTLDTKSNDEFGVLANNCNKLIENLRELIHGIVSRSNQLATASEETSMVVKESTVAINEQRAQVEQAATATTEMASTSYAVMDRAKEALEDIKQADQDAERVKVISDNNKQTIIKLAGEIEQASSVIHEVNEHSAAIGGILDVIRGIAEQTNLLALNAAIEAARAGEQGRGFAVVADEVRSLASKTQVSTEEIQSMIEQLQRGSKSAVNVMNHSKTQADVCVTQTEEATTALNSITDSVHQANDMSEQIVTAANEQNQVSNEISERLESIVAIAEQTASGAAQTDTSSREVAKLAEELRQSVEQFKLL